MKRRNLLLTLIVAYGLCLGPVLGQGPGPDWWFTRNIVLTNIVGYVAVTNHSHWLYPSNFIGEVTSNYIGNGRWRFYWTTYTTNATVTNDYAPALVGQIKWMAHQTAAQMWEQMGGVGATITAMTNRFSLVSNNVPANIGQVKNTVHPFYTRIATLGFTNMSPPWTTNITSDDRDFAPVNIGQVKQGFDAVGRVLEPLWGWVEHMDGTSVTFQVTNRMIFDTRYVFEAVTNVITNGNFSFEGIAVGTSNKVGLERSVLNTWLHLYDMDWFQDRDLTATRLFHKRRQRGVASTNLLVFDSRTLQIENEAGNFDRVYISGRPDRSEGWGLPAGIEIRETNHLGIVARGSVWNDEALRLDMAGKPSGEYAFEALGTGVEGLPDGPLYLVRWRPQFSMTASAEYLPVHGEPVVVTVESDSHHFVEQEPFHGRLVANPPGSVVFVDGTDQVEFPFPGSVEVRLLAADPGPEPAFAGVKGQPIALGSDRSITMTLQSSGAVVGAVPLTTITFPGGFIITDIDWLSGYAYQTCNGGFATEPLSLHVSCRPTNVTGTLKVWAGALNGVLITNIPEFSGDLDLGWIGGSLSNLPPEVFSEWKVGRATATDNAALGLVGWIPPEIYMPAAIEAGTVGYCAVSIYGTIAKQVMTLTTLEGAGGARFAEYGGTVVTSAFPITEFGIEGLTNNGGCARMKLTVDIYYDAEGSPCTVEKEFYVLNMNIVPDWNHDRKIDNDDKDKTTISNPFRIWKNDDDDFGDISEDDSDLPGQSGLFDNANYEDDEVNGRSDLLDFFPVWLDLHDMLNILPPTGSIQCKLKHADEAVRLVYTDLTKGRAGNYLTTEGNTYGQSFNQNSFEADTIEITSSGVDLDDDFLDKIKNDATKGVLMVEGIEATTAPLVLEVWKDGVKIYEKEMPLSVDGVEKFYRWINLRSVAGGGVNRATDTSEPANYPDSYCNGKQFIFVHGYSVSENAARGWNAEIFKRLYQAGSRAMFTAVTWFGNEGQVPEWIPWLGSSTPDYYANVVNAFETSLNLAVAVSGLSGQKYIAGHSLGNMLVSSAIKDNGLSVNTYFMLNAAVAKEAYQGTASDIANMRHPDWQDYDSRLWASEWYQLFGSNDGRNILTWRDRFGAISVAQKYYSSTEDVLDNGDGQLHNPLVSHWAWYNQEVRKGTTLMWLAPGNCEGGWGFNVAYTNDDGSYPLLPAAANTLTDDNIRTNSFFAWFDEDTLYGTNGRTVAQQPVVYRRLLADGIPALSFAMGRNDLSGFGAGSHDLSSFRRGNYSNDWPRTNNDWQHSDIKNIAYPFNRAAFDNIVFVGALK